MLEVKKCSKCGEEKPLSSFHGNKASSDGRFARCKTCQRDSKAVYYASNAEKVKEVKAAWRAANPATDKSGKTAWYIANREKEKARKAAWHAANPDKAAVNRSRRRAKELGRHHEPWLPVQIDDRTDGHCALCGLPVFDDEQRHYDHIYPHSIGGNTVPSNLVLTHARCNLKKHNKHVPLKIKPKPPKPLAEYIKQPSTAIKL